MFISKSLLTCASLLVVLSAQTSAYVPNARDNGAESVEIARRATISQLAAKQTSKKTVFEACTGDDQCQQGCCGFSTGKCAGPDVAQTNGSGGCGRGSKVPNCNVATLLGFKNCIAGAKNNNLKDAAIQQSAAFVSQLDGLPFTPAKRDIDEELSLSRRTATIAQLAAKQTSKKTVFEACTGDDQCQQGCCGFSTGKCAGPDVAQTNGSGGCGRGSKAPNCNVATLLGFKNCIAGAKNNNLKDAAIQQSAAFVSQLDNLPFTPSKRYIDEEINIARREGKFAPGLLKARVAELELETRQYDELD
ncbi:hypothetical protein MSAN_01622100 [Mycena sanguinolenta]|uniref:Uncharacterized protein n=1 Tax=Mycena sanguinolenta TaxID=230812 RepID=A0A8H7CUD0_9AGAR|nr:hypothetical protein MSAN_01622100 [Mycena sanguinolenta]